MRTTNPTKRSRSCNLRYLYHLFRFGFSAPRPSPEKLIRTPASKLGTVSNPNGIAVDEASGDVYVATLGVDTRRHLEGEHGGSFPNQGEKPLSAAGPPEVTHDIPEQGREPTTAPSPPHKVNKFDAKAVRWRSLRWVATSSPAPAHPQSFLSTPAYGTPAAIAVDNSTSPSDPSAGDLYVMDAGNGVIDKFSPSGEYLSQITGFTVTANCSGSPWTRTATFESTSAGPNPRVKLIDVFDDTSANHLVARQLTKSDESLHLVRYPEDRIKRLSVLPSSDGR